MGLFGRFGPVVGLDLGSSATVVYLGRDRVVREPSAVAYDERTDAVVAVGHGAKEMDGRAPGRIRVVYPVRRGIISDYRAANVLAETLVKRAFARRSPYAPRIVATIPGHATDIACNAVEQAIRASGGRSRVFVQEAVAAAVGARLDVKELRAHLVVDIGGGTTEVAAMGLGGVIALHSVAFGSEDFDRAIQAHLAAERFSIGNVTAESLKRDLGFIGRAPGREPVRVSGFDHYAAAPRTRDVTEAFVGAAMAPGFDTILAAVTTVLEASPPEVAADLLSGGITLAGGGALVTGLAETLEAYANVRVSVAPDPLLCVARGAATILQDPALRDLVQIGAETSLGWNASLRIATNENSSVFSAR